MNCKSPWQIGVGQNIKSADVLPPSEMRSAAPIRTTVANNIIYNTQWDKKPVLNHSEMDGILFKNNAIDNNGRDYSEYEMLENSSIKMKKINDWLYVPYISENSILNNAFEGYDFGMIQYDMFGGLRSQNNSIGAVNQLDLAKKFVINKRNYGPNWFSAEEIIKEKKS